MKKPIILDFGCGTDRYPNATAIDISERYLGKEGDVKWDMDNYPYPLGDNHADLIYCSHVIEHLKKPEKTLREFARIIKPSGKIIIKVPHACPQSQPPCISTISPPAQSIHILKSRVE